jgi:hypothetical protein
MFVHLKLQTDPDNSFGNFSFPSAGLTPTTENHFPIWMWTGGTSRWLLWQEASPDLRVGVLRVVKVFFFKACVSS